MTGKETGVTSRICHAVVQRKNLFCDILGEARNNAEINRIANQFWITLDVDRKIGNAGELVPSGIVSSQDGKSDTEF